jgi:hypothetical protein
MSTCDGLQCGFTCVGAFHPCGSTCASNTSILTCGASCSACPTPAVGTATCDGTSCGVSTPTFRLTVTTTGIAGAAGTATPSPAGTSCGAGCFIYAQGQVVKVMAAGASPAIFGAWSGDCDGQGASCSLTMSADRTAAAHFRPNMNIVFVSEATTVPSAIGSSLVNADMLCASSASRAFLGGSTWKAWLSTSAATTNINAATHVGASATGWIRVDGRPVATSMANLVAGKIYYPPRLSELGTDRLQLYAVLTGTNGDGTPMAGGTCGDWTSTTGSGYYGNATETTESWSFEFILAGDSCGTASSSIYCFENDAGMAAVPAPVAPANARHAFVSKTAWTPGGGVAAADTLCQTDAISAALANAANYRALLATTVAATDPTRISLTGQPWYRLDGAQLVATAADLAAPAGDKMLTSLNLSSAGQYVTHFAAWTGSGVAPSSTAMTLNCSNWTSSSATALAWWGLINGSSPVWWAGNNSQTCATPVSVYCFER